jgi:hypothetical protein
MALQIARQPLRGKLNRSERVLDFVRDALSDFLPGSRFLRAQKVGQVVHYDDVTSIGPARAERTHRNCRAKESPRRGKFKLLRGCSQA